MLLSCVCEKSEKIESDNSSFSFGALSQDARGSALLKRGDPICVVRLGSLLKRLFAPMPVVCDHPIPNEAEHLIPK